MFPFTSSLPQLVSISLTDVSVCSLSPPVQSPLPHSSLQLPLGCKAYKEMGVFCCIGSSLIASPHQNLFVITQKKSSCNLKVVFFIPEKEEINRYIPYCYAHSSLIPSQFVTRSLLTAGSSIVCHRSNWPLLVLLL